MDSLSSLTPVEVAELLKITKNTVYELIKRGELPSYKVGKKIRVDIKDVEEYINSQKTGKVKDTHFSNKNIDINNNFKIIISGQDVVLDILARSIEKKLDGINTFRSYIGSYNALYELYNGRVSIASSHLWDFETDEYNSTFVKKLLPGIPCVLINLAYRMQGFYVAKGNPKEINTWEDLTRPNITLVNREKGSGTRVLLDGKLRLINFNGNYIKGYDNEELSHLGVASTVSRGIADVGLGNEKAALQVNNIDFIPLHKERYDLVIKKEDLQNPVYQTIVNIINSAEFKAELQGLGGYDLTDTGKTIAKV
ncbi:helix-turn-helix transcriptional regulator [Clostridioides sp. ES-S-0108-01]|uniref:helix-turn-helix transcriptional regulator n=1 Tax=unclassified Clostridioides TaxID=2635829 RepID=UPI001D0C66CE|nr:helix-turn-helix transcriptional regulator [Clostridioides sp. ES-S-0171-01]MCC0686872.1 helix-turn-helix transcriptional regulator [Clostridioides sp. ES-S-0056-01]MCC0713614.1 helix-turn-helix transcriptional regulator [Clostridioides sp. ES-S-0077-01]MCC0782208.1 helix-turn-helix transcriptional regulator [Clostridioides sp. ES-S-0108-01]UDN51921.1 helix-turn-helix transcriptional regulator [Clostridioides sp. ES-S-0107-01]UDN55443.1 helix-turn-helix transcriptional regulator [Clostridio